MSQDPEYYRQYRLANAEKVRARAAAYYQANREKKKAYARAYYAEHKEEYRDREHANPRTPEQKLAARRRAHGIADATGERKSGECAICHEFTDPLNCDHDHTTGLTRGWLCPNCNRGLGMFRDSPERLEAAAQYLRVTARKD